MSVALVQTQSAPALISNINEEELILQAFGMDNLLSEPTLNEFSKQEFLLANDVLKYTSVIDANLCLVVIEGPEVIVSRDVLATYKTLLYRSIYTADILRRELGMYKYLSLLLGIGTIGLLCYLAYQGGDTQQ